MIFFTQFSPTSAPTSPNCRRQRQELGKWRTTQRRMKNHSNFRTEEPEGSQVHGTCWNASANFIWQIKMLSHYSSYLRMSVPGKTIEQILLEIILRYMETWKTRMWSLLQSEKWEMPLTELRCKQDHMLKSTTKILFNNKWEVEIERNKKERGVGVGRGRERSKRRHYSSGTTFMQFKFCVSMEAYSWFICEVRMDVPSFACEARMSMSAYSSSKILRAFSGHWWLQMPSGL